MYFIYNIDNEDPVGSILVVDSPAPKSDDIQNPHMDPCLIHMRHTSVNQKTFPAREMNANIWTLLQQNTKEIGEV